MNNFKKILSVLLLAVVFSGCSIHHHIADDYGQYLENNRGKVTFDKFDNKAAYVIDEKTKNHKLEFRSAMVGYAHVWVVHFGRILESTLTAGDFQFAFNELAAPKSLDSVTGLLLSFSMNSYTFEGFEATVNMNIKATEGETELVNKTYEGKGVSQGGKMFWGGAFAMKNAIQQSTKDAIDEILTEFVNDLEAAYGS